MSASMLAAAAPGGSASIASPMLWALTIGGVIALFVLDFIITRRPTSTDAAAPEKTGSNFS